MMIRAARLCGLALLCAVVWGPAAARSAPADEKKGEPKLAKEEQTVVELSNATRAQEKQPLTPLKVNATLVKVARAQAAAMAKHKKVPDADDAAKDLGERLKRAGYDQQTYAVNVGKAGKGTTPEDLFKGWTGAKANQEHILNTACDEIGVGVATDSKGTTYYAQVLAKHHDKAARKEKKDDGKKDAAKLQGAWTLESQEVGGNKAGAEAIKGMTLVIKDDKWLLSFGPGKPTNTAVIVIDPTKDPKLVEIRGPLGRAIWSGLYKLDGDTLTICRPVRPGGVRPKELKSGDDNMLWVWKRAGKK